MAHAKLDPMFTELKGRLGNVVFYKRLGKQCLRRYVIPRNPDTEFQRANRHVFRDAVISWKVLPTEEKDAWDIKVRRMKKAMSGYNLYISEYMKTYTDHCLPADTVQLQERYMHGSIPLRTSLCSAPYMIKNMENTAFSMTGYSPG